MNEIAVRKRPAPPSAVPGARVASAFDVKRRGARGTTCLGRVVPDKDSSHGYSLVGATWVDLGKFQDSNAAMVGVIAAFDKVQRVAK